MDSGRAAPNPSASPGGLIVMVRSDPAAAARALAQALHAELAIGGQATESALDRVHQRTLQGADLDALADAMRRADTVRDRTRAAALDRLAQRLNTTLAIHPDTLRRAAEQTLAAAEALAVATEAGERRGRRSRRVRRGGGGLAAAGAAIGVLGLPPVGLAAVAAGAVSAGASWFRHERRPVDHLDALRHDAERARARWEQVAGAGADPRAVDQVIHRYDPQHQVVASLVGEDPAVRAADRAARERRLAWVAAWRRAVGDDAALTPSAGHLLQREQTELWLSGDPGPSGHDVDTLVIAAPYTELTDDRARRLHLRLLDLPPGQRVIVVLPPGPDDRLGAPNPGIGWIPGLAPSPEPGPIGSTVVDRSAAGAS